MDATKSAHAEGLTAALSRPKCCPVVELRQYTVYPGQRDALIALFERVFIEPQEAAGITAIGQFRDLEDPDRFVWLRGFSDMDQRLAALQDFYGGTVWREHRETANALIADSDDVLLLRPARPRSGFILDPTARPSSDAAEVASGLVVATILRLLQAPEADVLGWFEDMLAPTLVAGGASILAVLVTEASPNTFPALPVREGEQVFIWFAHFPHEAAFSSCAAARSPEENKPLWEPVVDRLSDSPQVLRLSPTRRSLVGR